MTNFMFQIMQEVLDLGIKVVTARISGVKNFQTSPELDAFIATELESIRHFWTGKDYTNDPVLQGFADLHAKVGRSNKKYPASPEVLLRLFLEKGRFPRINAVVDIYNLVSLTSRLALGAHDIRFIHGNVSLRLTTGTETFIPLGQSEPVVVPAGEYVYCDEENNIICRMEVLQVEPTKITHESTDIFLIVQGNEKTSGEYVKQTADKVLKFISEFCEGTADFLNS